MTKRQAKSYSIVDHDLLHGGYLGRLSHKALALYLFLAIVGDSTGRSFYSTASVSRILRVDHSEVCATRDELVREGLIEYKPPYWRVLTLTYPRESGSNTCLRPLINQVLKKSEVAE